MIASVIMAAGRAILKLARTLSFMAQPWVLQAAMVVSEMKERLSPNMAPPMTEPMQSGRENPETLETATAMGVISVMVPTLVPMATETKHAATNRTATAAQAGVTVADDLFLPRIIINDGRLLRQNLRSAGYEEKWLLGQLRKAGAARTEDVFLLTVDEAGSVVCVLKEESK